ncbi:MAG TPA: RNA-binding S4 domain-containing protein [Candidatus Kryptonia bacterium]|nr:RNA-binding S4 domain-containing protein [Candidatus Kryptonia bacterium]
MSDEANASVRLDRWLWAARMFRSRTLAAEACDGGKVHVNGGAAKPHKLLRVGDRLTITIDHSRRQLEVRELSERRGPFTEAQRLYVDHTAPPPPRVEREPPLLIRERGSGRPTKRERRQIDRLRW